MSMSGSAIELPITTDATGAEEPLTPRQLKKQLRLQEAKTKLSSPWASGIAILLARLLFNWAEAHSRIGGDGRFDCRARRYRISLREPHLPDVDDRDDDDEKNHRKRCAACSLAGTSTV